tara:strand:- start:156 stop:524 length:369 start_codon:yes stop_codon:yes gene_type:complete
MDNIVKVIEDEINVRVSKRLSNFMVTVSKDFKIPIRLLLRYLEEPGDEPSRVGCCRGIKKSSGKPCDKKAKVNGYCMFHLNQDKVLHKPLTIVNDTGAELKSQVVHAPSPKSGVIDMNLIRI